jgi:hypothetical protein
MAVSITSRYRPLGIQEAQDTEGQPHTSVPIRRHDPRAQEAIQYQHRVTGVEGIEYLAWRFFGSSESWWRIADANPVRFPLDVRAGDAVAIPTNENVGRIEDRARVF